MPVAIGGVIEDVDDEVALGEGRGEAYGATETDVMACGNFGYALEVGEGETASRLQEGGKK